MNYDTTRVNELVEQYANAESQEERREIENEILKTTVWENTTEHGKAGEEFATFTREQFEKITAEIETDDKEIQVLLRRPYVKLL